VTPSGFPTIVHSLLCPFSIFIVDLFRTAYPFNTPGAFLPHSAINLSVKTEDGGAAQNPEPSPQILDLTRPLRYNILIFTNKAKFEIVLCFQK
jgi:hypothetical protein